MNSSQSAWPTRPLAKCGKVLGGGTPSKQNADYWDGEIPWITAKEMKRFELSDSELKITNKGLSESSAKLIPKNSLLFVVRGSILYRHVPIAINRVPCTINQDMKAIVPDEDLLVEYLANMLLGANDELKGMVEVAGNTAGKLPTPSWSAFEIAVPPIDEQRRIVARIEELTRRAEEARKLAAEREAELDALLQSLYSRMIEGVEWKSLKEVASLVRRAVKTKPDGRYEEMGIRSFGKGTFQKPVLTGKQIGNKRIYTIHEGDLVFNNVFAWEKAIAVAKAEDHGRAGSHRFITYVPHEGQATSEFLCHHFLGERGIEDIRAASPGSAGRNRTLGLKKLEQILVPVPEYDEQKRFADIAKRRQLIQLETAGIEEELKAFHAALLAKAFRGEL